jgi:hypothetical protein
VAGDATRSSRGEAAQSWKRVAYRRHLQSQRMARHQYVRNTTPEEEGSNEFAPNMASDDTATYGGACSDTAVGISDGMQVTSSTTITTGGERKLKLRSRYFSGKSGDDCSEEGMGVEDLSYTAWPHTADNSCSHASVISADNESWGNNDLPLIAPSASPWSSDDWHYGRWGANRGWKERYVLHLRAALAFTAPPTAPVAASSVKTQKQKQKISSVWKESKVIGPIFDDHTEPTQVIATLLSVSIHASENK